MIRTYKYRVLPNKGQTKALERLLDLTRYLYNAALQERRDAYEKQGKSISRFDQHKSLTQIRAECEEYDAIPICFSRGALNRIDLAFQAFFRRCKAGEKPGYPRFKSKARYNTLELLGSAKRALKYQQGDKWARLHSKKAWNGGMRVFLHRPIPPEAQIKEGRLTKDDKGWVLSLVLKLPDVSQVPTHGEVGVDVGLKQFIVTSDDDYIPNPRYLEAQQKELRRAQRSVSRKKKGGKNRAKAIKRVARLHRRIRNKRMNFHYEVATMLVNKGKRIAIEDLNIKGLSRARLAKQVHDVAWGRFFHALLCKAESAGIEVAKVDPKNTSQECSGCGNIVRKSLAVRTHKCGECGLVMDRDRNAAENIKNRAVHRPAGAKIPVAESCQEALQTNAL